MTISGFVAYVKQAWKNKPDTSTPLSATRLTHVEEGVKANSDAIAKIAAAVINQQANDVNKIPSSALMYSVNEKVDKANSDLAVKADAANISSQIAISTLGQVVKVPFGKIDNTTIAHLDGGDMVIDVAGWYYTRLNICFSENTNERNYHDYRIVINNAVSVSGIGNIPNPVVGGLTQYPLSDIVYLNKSDRIRIDVIIGKSCNIKLAHTKIVLLRK